MRDNVVQKRNKNYASSVEDVQAGPVAMALESHSVRIPAEETRVTLTPTRIIRVAFNSNLRPINKLRTICNTKHLLS